MWVIKILLVIYAAVSFSQYGGWCPALGLRVWPEWRRARRTTNNNANGHHRTHRPKETTARKWRKNMHQTADPQGQAHVGNQGGLVGRGSFRVFMGRIIQY